MDDMTLLQAVQFARSRKVLLPAEYYSLDLTSRQYASTVSYLAGLDQIESVLSSAYKVLESGGTFADFQKLVDESGIELSESHLDNVFRTNIQNAYARGKWSHQQQNKDKRPYLEYMAINDSRVRPTHLALDGVIRHIDDPFWQKYYPTNGFRCFLPDTRIEGASHGAIKRFYSGKIVELVTKSGRKLRVTANHPILTSRGWVIAELIKQGDNLIAYDRPVESLNANGLTRKVYNDEFVPTSENLFNAFVGHAFAAGKTSTFKFDRNFCISDCEIHIDILNSGLVININSKSVEGFSKINLEYRCNTVFSTTVLPTIRSSNRSDAVMNVVFSKDSADISSGCVADFCDFTLSDFIGFVLSKNSNLQISIGVSDGIPSGGTLAGNSTLGLFDSLPLDRFGLASSSQDNALFDELSSHGVSDDSGLFGYLVDAHASHVAVDPVVNVIEDCFSGHVYDFQSDCGLLSANGIITHNCRCTTTAITEKQAIRKGITSDDDLPDVQPDKGWSFQPSNYDAHPDTILKSRQEREASNRVTSDALVQQIAAQQVELSANEMIKRTLVDVDADQLSKMVEKTIKLDPEVRPSDLIFTLGLSSETDNKLTELLKLSAIQKDQQGTVGKSIWDKVTGAFNRLFSIAKNAASKLTGNSIRGIDGLNLNAGNIIGIQTPTLFKQAEKAGKQITILDAKGIAIDLNKISGLNGALLAPDLNLEVVSITDDLLVLKRTDQKASRYFVADQTVISLY